MKNYLLLLIAGLLSISARAQFYYNDILATQKMNREYKLLQQSGFKKTVLESFEDDDTPSAGFFCEKRFNNDFSRSRMVSKSYITGESELETFYDGGRVIKTVTETAYTTNSTAYGYEEGRLTLVRTTSMATGDSIEFLEERKYQYDTAGVLTGMQRFKNGRQVSAIRFVADNRGNIIEELPEAESVDRKYYYYYDEQNRLTDVVHFNPVAQRLLPDFMFVYKDQDNQPAQMISVDESGRNYYIWRYAYTADGLPEIQKCYSKEKRLLGTIQFEYLK